MGFQPQRTSGDGWINTDLFPPSGFVSAVMNFTVMSRQRGTVNSSLTLRPSARDCVYDEESYIYSFSYRQKCSPHPRHWVGHFPIFFKVDTFPQHQHDAQRHILLPCWRPDIAGIRCKRRRACYAGYAFDSIFSILFQRHDRVAVVEFRRGCDLDNRSYN
jgi:hypothetical protein